MATPRRAALIVTRNLPPLIGGMERLIWHIVDAIKDDRPTHVVGPAGSERLLPAGVTASEVPLKPMPLFLLRAAWAALVSALRLRPVFVLAGSGLTAPIAWLAARLSGARAVVYLHGLDVETRHRLYRMLWRPLFQRFDLVIVNSHFTRNLALEARVPKERIRILNPGVELPEIGKRAEARNAFRSRFGFGEAPLMLYVGRITARKGLTTFIENILPRVLNARPDAKLVVIGDEPHGALLKAAHGERGRAEQALADKGMSSSVSFLGELAQDDPVLMQAYFAAEVMIFPVQDRPGDNEGFGMVAIEAAAHGLPTVAFAVGGVPDAVGDGVSGRLIPSGDNDTFADAVIDCMGRPADLKSRPFAEKFSWTEFQKELSTAIESVFTKKEASSPTAQHTKQPAANEEMETRAEPHDLTKKVCTIIITFNRHKLLSQCLNSISSQTKKPDHILIIDNASTDGTFERIKEEGWLENSNIHYLALEKNIGGAGGFHEGMKYANTHFPGSWMWLMDDDGYPDRTCLEMLYKQANTRNLDAIAPLQIDIENRDLISFPIFGKNYPKDGKTENVTKTSFLENTANLFNGLLISSKAVNVTGYPRAELFIRGDEVEYTKRLKRAKLSFGTLTSAHFFHPSDRNERIRIFFNSTVIRDAHSDFKNYYLFRNRALAFREDGNSWLIPLDLLRYTYYFVITKRLDLHGLSLWIKSTRDGFLRKLGKTD